MKPWPFEVELTVALERSHRIRVTGRALNPVPARRRGHPDTWAPGEGGTVEDLEAALLRGPRARPLRLSAALRDRLMVDAELALWP